MLMRLFGLLIALVTAAPALAQGEASQDALQRVRDSRAARAADQAERAAAVHDLLRPNGGMEPVVRSGSAFERQVLVGRSLGKPAGEETARSPRPVETQPIETLLIPQGKPFGRKPLR